MTFEYTSLAVTGQGNIKLVIYTALEEEGTAGKLRSLLSVPVSRAIKEIYK